jgi:hypothetical protein
MNVVSDNKNENVEIIVEEQIKLGKNYRKVYID